jgi:hypothetical protein
MGEVLSNIQSDWSDGVNTSLEADRLTAGASPRGHNTLLYGLGQGQIAIKRRPGCAIANSSPITGSPVVLGQYAYVKLASGVATQQHLAVTDGGRLDILSTAGTVAAADAAAPTPFTAGTNYPSFATAENLCFFANGVDLKKFNGTTVQTFGITRPTIGTMAVAAGASGTAKNGPYEFRVTYGNSVTGHESSASATNTTPVTLTNVKGNATNIPVSSDAQVDTRYIYARNTATMTVFYRVATIANNTATTATLDWADLDIIIQAPDTSENDPPVAGIRYLAWYQDRLFAASDSLLYYSQLTKPESFDPDNYEPVNANDGQAITGIVAAFECVLIFKTNSIWGLFGQPGSWEMRQVVPDVGCSSARTICIAEGAVYWLSTRGLMRMTTLGVAEAIGQIYLGSTFHPDILNVGNFSLACAVTDIRNSQVLLSVPEYGKSRNTRIIPFNYRIGKFDSDKWDPMDVSSMASVLDPLTAWPATYIANYKGQLFQWGIGQLDGVTVETSTIQGTITSSASTSRFSDSSATFVTAGAGLIERVVTFTGPTGTKVRRVITANTATELTVSDPTSHVTTSWTYVIAVPDFQLDTPWLLTQPRFWKKRFKHAFALVEANYSIYIDVLTDFSDEVEKTLTFTASSGAASWGSMIWGVSSWGTVAPHSPTRLRIGHTGMSIRLRLRFQVPSQDIVVFALGATGENKSERLN